MLHAAINNNYLDIIIGLLRCVATGRGLHGRTDGRTDGRGSGSRHGRQAASTDWLVEYSFQTV